MKKLSLALTVLGSVIASSLTALGYEDRRDHDWNDDYWHHHHYGYWHGERGYWRYHDHKHEFIRVGPDWSGLRTTLASKGITFNAQYAAEVWGNPTGGESTGTVYTGLMSFQGNVDLHKLVGWQGASLSTRWYWLSGQDISAEHVGNIFTVSSIAGYPTLRANELWFQQNFLNDRIQSAWASWGPTPSSISPPIPLSFSTERSVGHRISPRTSQLEALRTQWVRRVYGWRLRL
jgi:hypothetical protein